ncbi:MAG: hypothetical protein LIO72_01360 [Ruminococcus sp.]|nr:hypothetical protein [Ruminococcus sp.]
MPATEDDIEYEEDEEVPDDDFDDIDDDGEDPGESEQYSEEGFEEEPKEESKEQSEEQSEEDLEEQVEDQSEEVLEESADNTENASKADNSEAKDSHREALDNMSAYMNEHNYGPYDYAEYSKDPEWQRLNSALQQSSNNEVTTPNESESITDSPESEEEVASSEDVSEKSDVSAEIRESLGSFDQETWENLSEAEKEQAVERLRDSVAEDLQIKDKPTIVYYDNHVQGDFGYYDRRNNAVFVNRFYMDNPAETADTVAHETRHCWQHERADNPQTEQDYQFRENFKDYVRPEDDFYEYQNQPVEADAFSYAAEVREAIPGNNEEKSDGDK